MIYATKIKMKSGSYYSDQLTEIDEVFIEGCTAPGFYKKEILHDHLKSHPGSIKVKISPYPELIPAISANYEKYVRSTPNEYIRDNLLNLPRV